MPSYIPAYAKDGYNPEDGRSTSPAIVVAFVRYEEREPNRNNNGSLAAARPVMIVINDCIEAEVGEDKSSPNSSASLTLVGGDINYQTAVAPGDYFTINMVDSEGKAMELYDRLHGKKTPYHINGFDDGFKGVFRVQSVHKTLSKDGNGRPRLLYKITGYSFAELNDTIYFNPYMVTEAEKSNDVLFLTQMSTEWNKIIGLKNNNNSVQDLQILLFQTFLGKGINEAGRTLKGGLTRTENNSYVIPQNLGPLLGHSKAKYAADIVNFMAGIQSYKDSNNNPDKDVTNPQALLNPQVSVNGRVYTTKTKVRGVSYAKPEYWNQVRVWDLLNNYLNNVVNEMYTCFKPDPTTGRIVPTLIVRQKPFTSEKFAKSNSSITATRFLSLPRWVITPYEALSFHIGTDDAARINFVQVFGRSQALSENTSINEQIRLKNYDLDRNDIKRQGLRPLIASSNFDYDGSDKRLTETPLWAKLLGDWTIGGHLKHSGSIMAAGIQRPITVGDNLEFEGGVYHIESLRHVFSYSGGKPTFRTMVNFSHGMANEENAKYSPYLEMQYADADLYREKAIHKDDNESLEPGISDSQDLPNAPNRSLGEKTKANPNKGFSSGSAPNKEKTKIRK
jgi:hypothetical protein